MTPNAELAARLLVQADDAMRQRKILLCARVALSTTTTTASAVRALRDWDGPAEIRDAAIALLDQHSQEPK
jgi:hypothetical protein